ncbi:MAG: IS110 family transposase, partial [Promicromonosporaceae bacterium]|nr:IS110 family transposase [Promicromonosporaceae bacterium]
MGMEFTSVGLDVHARSIAASAIDVHGVVHSARLAPEDEYRQVLDWVAGLPGEVKVVYEAGPTGFGLARVLQGVGVGCLV